MARDPDDGSRKILIGALVLSVVLHALLALFSLVVPFARAVAAQLEPDPPEIRFTFQEPDPVPDAPDGERRGEVLAERRPEPSPRETTPIPLPRVETPQPPSPQPPSQQPTPAEPRPSRSEEVAESEPDEARAEADERPGMDLPRAEEGSIAPGEGAPQPGVDLESALRSFQDAVERSAAAQPPPRSERNVFVPDPGDLPTQGAPYGLFEFSSRDFDWSDYARQLYERVMVAWYRRLDRTTSEFERWGRARSSLELVDRVPVQFTIRANGDVTDIRVLQPSTCGALDLSATDALEEVLLPALPDDFPRDREVVTGTFVMRVADVFRMDDYFDYLKRNGIWPMNRAVPRDPALPIDGNDPRR